MTISYVERNRVQKIGVQLSKELEKQLVFFVNVTVKIGDLKKLKFQAAKFGISG